MNQILISEKLYVTPRLKKKKTLFKIEFFLSVFLICVLSTYAIYAEYDRNKSEEVSRQILEGMNIREPEKRVKESIVVILNSPNRQARNIIREEIVIPEEKIFTATDGTRYYTIGIINIPEIDVNYPIISTFTDELLKIAPCKFWGPSPNEAGNFVVVGHNYKNDKFFSKVPGLNKGSKIQITDLSNRTITYEVYDTYIVPPTDTSCTSQLTDGRKEITIVTCTNDMKQRVIVKAREVLF